MYHYTDGGLRNVWLANGYAIKKTPFGEGVAFHNLDGLTWLQMASNVTASCIKLCAGMPSPLWSLRIIPMVRERLRESTS